MYIYTYLYTYTYFFSSIYLCLCKYVYVCINMNAYIYISIYIHIFFFKYISMFMQVCICLHKYECIYIHAHIYMFTWGEGCVRGMQIVHQDSWLISVSSWKQDVDGCVQMHESCHVTNRYTTFITKVKIVSSRRLQSSSPQCPMLAWAWAKALYRRNGATHHNVPFVLCGGLRLSSSSGHSLRRSKTLRHASQS